MRCREYALNQQHDGADRLRFRQVLGSNHIASPSHLLKEFTLAQLARSLIDVNSDTVVIEELDPEFYATVMNSKGKDGVPAQWTDLMVYHHAEGGVRCTLPITSGYVLELLNTPFLLSRTIRYAS